MVVKKGAMTPEVAEKNCFSLPLLTACDSESVASLSLQLFFSPSVSCRELLTSSQRTCTCACPRKGITVAVRAADSGGGGGGGDGRGGRRGAPLTSPRLLTRGIGEKQNLDRCCSCSTALHRIFPPEAAAAVAERCTEFFFREQRRSRLLL